LSFLKENNMKFYEQIIDQIREKRLKPTGKTPFKCDVDSFRSKLTCFLFPVLGGPENSDCKQQGKELYNEFISLLNSFDNHCSDIRTTADAFFEKLPTLYDRLLEDADAICQGDPAAQTVEEVIVSYPGFYAVLTYRIAHALDELDIPVIPRMMSEIAHSKTGIDIHPKAKIGRSFCIDHGTGIVIGESTDIGDFVKLYQNVTLGALSVKKDEAGQKRHPTIGNRVTVYSGATILGGRTVVGDDCTIGGNVWLTRSVEPDTVVLNRSAARFKKDKSKKDLSNYRAE
jgi:serine O-acetyltransferase